MKTFIPTLLLLLYATTYGQTLDSIPSEFGNLYYHTYGEGEAILVLSGGPGNDVKTLESIADSLSQKNKVILLEQRGTGMSKPTIFNKSSLSIDGAIADINAVLNKLEIDKITILGHSYGSALTTIYASKFPERVKSLILVTNGFFDFDSAYITVCNIKSSLGLEDAKKWETLYDMIYFKEMTESEKNDLNFLTRLAYFYEKTKTSDYLKLIEKPVNDKTKELLDQDLLNYNFDLKIGLNKISAPIDIIVGRQDILNFMAYEYKIAKPEVNIHWIDECGHFPMFETPNEFYKIVKKLL